MYAATCSLFSSLFRAGTVCGSVAWGAASGGAIWRTVAAEAAESTEPGDDALARAAQAGERQALGRLVERHRSSVTRLLWRFARSPADLEDLVQETFLRAVRGLPGWEPRQPFSHWLQRIASNVGRDYFRRGAVRRRYLMDSAAEEAVEDRGLFRDAVDPGADPAARAAANEVKAVFDALPADERALLTLHHLEGWDLRTIAAQYGWTVTATKLRAWRARRRLHQLLIAQGLR